MKRMVSEGSDLSLGEPSLFFMLENRTDEADDECHDPGNETLPHDD